MNYQVIFEKKALRDIKLLTTSNRKSDVIKLNQILDELELHPTTGTGNPEKLKYNLSGYWSRCLNKKDRLIYEIFEEPERMVVVVSALGHYD